MTQISNRPKVILLSAMSIDGFIAPVGKETVSSTVWTSEEDRQFFTRKSKEIGTMILGSKTFETIKKSLPERHIIIMTSQPDRYAEYSHPSLVFTDDSPSQILKQMFQQGVNQVALCGGARIYSLFLSAGLVDEMYLTVEPHLFGSGVKFCSLSIDQSWKLIDQQKLNQQGTMILRYQSLNEIGV